MKLICINFKTNQKFSYEVSLKMIIFATAKQNKYGIKQT